MALIDPDLKDFLTDKFKTISEKMDDIIKPILKDIEQHRNGINDLFGKDQHNKERITEIETIVKGHMDGHAERLRELDIVVKNHLDTHKEKDGSKKFGIEMYIIIGIFILSSVLSFVIK